MVFEEGAMFADIHTTGDGNGAETSIEFKGDQFPTTFVEKTNDGFRIVFSGEWERSFFKQVVEKGL